MKLKKTKNRTTTCSFGTNGRINHDSSKFYNSKLYSELSKNNSNEVFENKFPKELLNTIVLGSSENLNLIPDNSIHLMITSPPYNVSKVYDEDLSLVEYLDLLKNVFSETYRVLVNGGRACINVANIGRKPYIPLSDLISKIMIEIGFNMRGEIIWNKGAGAGTSMAWGSWQSATNPVLRDVHEYILIFSKGDYQRKNGVKENTITREQFMEWTKSVWTMNPESAKKVNHPAPFPEELPYRLIQLYSFKDDIILDPFMGSGTTAIAALKSHRNFVGYDINPEYKTNADKRIKNFISQQSFEL
ncbi:MAG: SAM-dependent methyltransferase [Ignavibacteria bacterium GWB2_35_12]|nr:MAG: SAM-dependent methyltransferase [Ignavibacteria bacterium GWA2_35_8]OGU41507.1 MAG: SAM-dependent methyltransferase [Ignavibacteria bacterium GWB2_35_12]OGU92994.1 MAG: SAM-dependent methyltransferase [Ignavibacteria bacterium RIFOXYA2_FULL_35_10]OGV22981.1 MAG: SAM-dependent methyltransferase [Ignavibacteria bacterium RIFOXYC2_FULL_35_21]